MSLPDNHEDVHEEAAAWCFKLMSNELTAEERTAFFTWRRAAVGNDEVMRETLSSWLAFEEINSLPEMIDVRATALQDFRRTQTKSTEIKKYRAYAFAAAAATLLVGITMPFWLIDRTQTFHTASGERRNIILADGSAVFMDSDSTVSVKLSAQRRQIQLESSRANFSVAKDPLRPFAVEAGGKVVVATGTRFTVERTSSDIRVILYEGHVMTLNKSHSKGVSQPLRLETGNELVLKINEELVSPIGSDRASLSPVDGADTLSWETGQLVFRSVPLSLAVDRVNRYARKKIIVADNVDKSITVSGAYLTGDTDAFLDGITSVTGLSYASKPEGYVLFPKRRGH